MDLRGANRGRWNRGNARVRWETYDSWPHSDGGGEEERGGHGHHGLEGHGSAPQFRARILAEKIGKVVNDRLLRRQRPAFDRR